MSNLKQVRTFELDAFDIGDVSEGRFYTGEVSGTVTVEIQTNEIDLASEYGDPTSGGPVFDSQMDLERIELMDYDLHLFKIDQDGGEHDGGSYDPSPKVEQSILRWVRTQLES